MLSNKDGNRLWTDDGYDHSTWLLTNGNDRSGAILGILAGSSQSLISDCGDSEFYRQRQRKEGVSAEIKASLDLSFGGQGTEEKQMRLTVSKLIFSVKSKEAADQLPLEQLERALSKPSSTAIVNP